MLAIENPSCGSCKYSERQRLSATEIQRVLICKRFPPQLITVPNAQGLAIQCAFPIVEAGIWCHEYAPDLAANDVSLPGEFPLARP